MPCRAAFSRRTLAFETWCLHMLLPTCKAASLGPREVLGGHSGDSMRPCCTQVSPRSPSDMGTDVKVAGFHLQVGEAALAQCLALSMHSINGS